MTQYADLWGTDRAKQNAAYESVMRETAQPVPWADERWADVVGHLGDADNHNRAIAAQLLCNLAARSADGRGVEDLPALIEVTHDARFVTARHCLQSLWKFGLAGERSRTAVLRTLADRFRSADGEKNGTLIRSDIVETLRTLYDQVPDEAIRAVAQTLIASEQDEKYRKKYATFWR